MKRDLELLVKKLSQIKKVDWDVQRFNAYPFFLSSAATLSGFKLPWGLKYAHFLMISHNQNIEWHYDKADYQRIGKIFWEHVQTLEDLFLLINEYRVDYEEAVRMAEYLEDNLKTCSLEELQDLLKKQVERLSASGAIAHIIECVTFVAEQKLRDEYDIDPSNIKASKSSFLKKAQLYAYELCNSNKTEEEILKQFKKRYEWMQSSYLGRNEVSIETIRELAHKPETETYSDKEWQKEDSQEFVEIVSHVFSWQDERKGNLLASVYASQPVLEALAEKLGISKESIKFLLPEEIDLMADVNFQNTLTERSKLFIDYAPSSLQRISLTGNEAQQFIDDFSREISDTGGNIKGQVAFAGKVNGIVRVCLSLESINNFKPGEVLVASMTRPEYIPAMKKAIAFITDEGGITCHAAIIAREMQKPCIIGTKIATQVFKDGDWVEVDADSGIVRIIK